MENGSINLALTSPRDRSIAVSLGNGDGTFNPPQIYPASQVPSPLNPSPGEVTVADVNGDDSLDVVFANFGYSSVGVLLGNPSGAFYGPSEFPMGKGAISLVVTDLDGDGAPDVVTARRNVQRSLCLA